MNNAHIISIGSLASFSRGLTYSGSDEVDYSSNVVLRSNNIDLATNTLNFDELKYISDAINIPEDKKLQRNSIFMCMSNGSKQHLGKVAFIDRDYPYAFGGFMGLIKPKEDIIIPKLLYYYFCSSKFKGFLSSIGNGANINNIKFVDIAKDHISVPDKTTQQSIIEELDKINELIRLKKEQLKDYDNLAQSIFYEMFGDPVVNEKGWEVKKFADLYKLKSGTSLSAKNFVEGEIPVYGGNGISGYHNDFNMDGDFIIIGRVGVYCGNVREVHGKFWLTDNAFQLFYNREIQYPCFIHYLLEILDLHKYANAAAQPVISNLTLKDVEIIIPPLSLQQLFAQRIELIEQQKDEIKSTIAALETLLASRMQYWFD